MLNFSIRFLKTNFAVTGYLTSNHSLTHYSIRHRLELKSFLFTHFVKKYFCNLLEKFCPFLEQHSQGSDCLDSSLISLLSSSAQDGSASRGYCAHAHCQVSVYHHHSLGPQESYPLMYCSSPVLYLRSARYNCSIPTFHRGCWGASR